MVPVGFGSWGLIATAVASLGLGAFVYSKNRLGLVNRVWLRLCLATSLWAWASSRMMESSQIGWAFLWARLSLVGLSFVPAFFLRLSRVLVNGEGEASWLHWNFRVAGVMAVLALTPLLIRDLQPEFTFHFYPVAGPLYGVFAAWFFGSFLYTLWVLMKAYQGEIGFKRNQLRYVIVASLIGLLAFFSMFPLAFGVPLRPMGQGLLLFYALISYSIVRWRLMDVSIVVKNTLVYATLYSILVGLFVVVVVFVGQWLFYGPQALDRRVLWMCLVALGIVTALGPPLDAWLTRTTDRLLFQKKYEWQKTLKEASRGMSQITSVDRLLRLMAHFIGMRLRVTHVGILYRSSDFYTVKVSRGRQKLGVGLTVNHDSPLVRWLGEKRESLTLEEVQRGIRHEKPLPLSFWLRQRPVQKSPERSRGAPSWSASSHSLEELEDQMRRLNAFVCVPAISRSRLLGFLILGEKLSGDPYSQEDLDLLTTLASEGAIALENAELYEQLFHRMHEIEDLYQREHRLFIHTAIALAAAVDARDPYTHGHTERCAAYALMILEEMGSHSEVVSIPRFKEMLKVAALLHDIGKIGVPDEILRKRGSLTPREIRTMREHSTIGAIILQPIKGMEEVAKAIRAHHERFDGTGYPDGLTGAEIPLVARIISVVDTFDTMTTDRPYRRRLSEEAAVKEIESCSGSQFDPMVVEAFLRAYRKNWVSHRPVEAAEMLA